MQKNKTLFKFSPNSFIIPWLAKKYTASNSYKEIEEFLQFFYKLFDSRIINYSSKVLCVTHALSS